jgi:hypothetical protein
VTEWSSTVLRNKGVPVNVQRISEGGDLLFDSKDEPMLEERWVRFSMNIIAELESKYIGRTTYDLQGEKMTAFGPTAWQDFLRAEPISTTRDIFAMMWNLTPAQAGSMLLTNQMAEYAGALVSAFAIAEGVDPQLATTTVRDKIAAVVADADALNSALRDSQATAQQPPS